MRQKDKYKGLPLDEKKQLWRWFKSQQAWHSKQPQNRWHKRQAQWFKNNARWLFTLDEMVFRTIRKHAPALIKNIQKNNVLYARICARHPDTAKVISDMRRHHGAERR